jgi:hypothetical protein
MQYRSISADGRVNEPHNVPADEPATTGVAA